MLCTLVSSKVFNLTSFSVISDPFGYKSVQVNMDEYAGGGTTFDRVIANEHGIYVRMYMYAPSINAIAIMNANDILQTKYVANGPYARLDKALSIGDSVHIIINDVMKNMGTKYNDAILYEDPTTITINNVDSGLDSYGTWVSTVKPDNPKVELNCEVVEVNGFTVTAYCGPDQWSDSVFNRLSLTISTSKSIAAFAYYGSINHLLFGRSNFPVEGSVPEKWDENTRYNVTGHESNLTIGNQFTIMELPESFVSYWVNMGAQAYMGNGDFDYAILVPPDP